MIGRSGERGSGISVPAAQHDDDDVMTQSAGAVEYTDFFSTEGLDSPNDSLEYDIKQSDGEASVIMELWGMQSAHSLPLLPGPLWPRVVTSDRSNRTKLCT